MKGPPDRHAGGRSSPLASAADPVRNGAVLVAFWRAEGLVGSRPDIADAPAHARCLRERVQRRGA